MERSNTKRQGFALIVVLPTLSIIALLFAIASSRSVQGLTETRTDMRIAENAQNHADLLALAVGAYGRPDDPVAPDTVLPVQWQGAPADLWLQDAGGLIDLNTANPAMLARLADALEVTPAQLDTYRIWRRSPLRLQRVSDFVRVIGAPAQLRESLTPIITVFSGRPGVAAEMAPNKLLELLAGRPGDQPALIRELPPEWVSPPSGVNYHVNVNIKGDRVISLGVISLREGANGLIINCF